MTFSRYLHKNLRFSTRNSFDDFLSIIPNNFPFSNRIFDLFQSFSTKQSLSSQFYGPFIKYVTLFWTNFDPLLSVTRCHTYLDPPKVRQISRTRAPPGFQQYMHTYMYICLYRRFALVRGSFCSESFVRGFLSEGFRPGWFLSIPYCHNTSVTTES